MKGKNNGIFSYSGNNNFPYKKRLQGLNLNTKKTPFSLRKVPHQ